MARLPIRRLSLITLVLSGWAHIGTAQVTYPGASTVGTSNTPPHGRFSRWLELQTGTIAARYKDAKITNGPWVYQLQYQFLTRGRFRIDGKGRYYAGFRLSTGKYFSYSWNATGAGDGDPATNIYLKELFFAAAPWKGIEVQFGGIGISKGESTEITGYSNNGYMMGERISIRRPDKLFFDEISATGAYIGDLYKPGAFQRYHRLGSMNYHQFLAARKIHQKLSFTLDYTFQDGIETLRQGVKFLTPGNRFADALVFENYQRLDFHPAWGYAFSIQKSPTPRLSMTGGYVDIDRNFVNWNADKLGRGKRVYVNASYNFWREFSAMIFAGKAFANDFPVINAARYDLVISYDFLRALKRADIF